MSQHAPVVMIVGGGFGGLAAAGTLKKEPVKVILFDRTNHHLFQPLLYQVATSVFAPGQIGLPLRAILRSSDNTMVILGELTGSILLLDRFLSTTPTANRLLSYMTT
jgi:NADH dehydrogenase